LKNSDSENFKFCQCTSSDSLVLVHSTLGSHREEGLVADSKVFKLRSNRQFYQLSDGVKTFESQALFSKINASLPILVAWENLQKPEKKWHFVNSRKKGCVEIGGGPDHEDIYDQLILMNCLL